MPHPAPCEEEEAFTSTMEKFYRMGLKRPLFKARFLTCHLVSMVNLVYQGFIRLQHSKETRRRCSSRHSAFRKRGLGRCSRTEGWVPCRSVSNINRPVSRPQSPIHANWNTKTRLLKAMTRTIRISTNNPQKAIYRQMQNMVSYLALNLTLSAT